MRQLRQLRRRRGIQRVAAHRAGLEAAPVQIRDSRAVAGETPRKNVARIAHGIDPREVVRAEEGLIGVAGRQPDRQRRRRRVAVAGVLHREAHHRAAQNVGHHHRAGTGRIIDGHRRRRRIAGASENDVGADDEPIEDDRRAGGLRGGVQHVELRDIGAVHVADAVCVHGRQGRAGVRREDCVGRGCQRLARRELDEGGGAIGADGDFQPVVCTDEHAAAEVQRDGEQAVAHNGGGIGQRPGDGAAAAAGIEQRKGEVVAAIGGCTGVVEPALVRECGALGLEDLSGGKQGQREQADR